MNNDLNIDVIELNEDDKSLNEEVNTITYTENCKLCDYSISANTSWGAKRKLGTHLKYKHKLTPQKYILKIDYNNIWPLCKCGCKQKVKYAKWQFGTYYLDHKNKCNVSIEIREKISNTLSKTTPEQRLNLFGITKETLIDLWEKYNTPDFPSIKICELVNIDFRIIKKYWLLLNITNQTQITRIGKMHKGVWSNIKEKNGQYIKIEEDILHDIYICLLENKHKLTLFDIKHKFNIKFSEHVILSRLIEKYNKDEILFLLKSGISSKPEMLFFNILVYYFGKKNIKQQFLLERKIYDFLLFDKLIIEFDGDYWHRNTQEYDKLKDEIALKNNYIIFRVKEKDAHDIDTLIKIRNIINEVQANTNQNN